MQAKTGSVKLLSLRLVVENEKGTKTYTVTNIRHGMELMAKLKELHAQEESSETETYRLETYTSDGWVLWQSRTEETIDDIIRKNKSNKNEDFDIDIHSTEGTLDTAESYTGQFILCWCTHNRNSKNEIRKTIAKSIYTTFFSGKFKKYGRPKSYTYYKVVQRVQGGRLIIFLLRDRVKSPSKYELNLQDSEI